MANRRKAAGEVGTLGAGKRVGQGIADGGEDLRAVAGADATRVLTEAGVLRD